MLKLLCFDDVLFTRRHNIMRRFHQPRWMDEAIYRDDVTPRGGGYNTVCPAADGGYLLYTMTVLRGNHKVLCLARSDDGVHFERYRFDPPHVQTCAHAVYPQDQDPHGSGQCVYYDTDDPDPSRRYKLVDPIHADPKYICMAYSADGLTWRRECGHVVLTRGSDTRLSMFRLPSDGRYVIHLRSWTGDRRIFRVTSDDCANWSQPQLVLHPSPLDPPMMQFYGMPVVRCGDVMIGMLWRYHTPFAATDHLKNTGWIDTELCYSHDGLAWNRTHQTFMPRREWGEYAGGSIYGCSMIERETDLLFYAGATRDEHQGVAGPIADPPSRATLVGSLRRDGFVSFTTEAGGVGELYTDALCLRDAALSLNIRAPGGEVRVAVCDVDCNPLPGYTLKDCAPLTGDGLRLRPRWNQHDDLAAARRAGWVRLHITLDRAELFAVEGDFGLFQRSGTPGADHLA